MHAVPFEEKREGEQRFEGFEGKGEKDCTIRCAREVHDKFLLAKASKGGGRHRKEEGSYLLLGEQD